MESAGDHNQDISLCIIDYSKKRLLQRIVRCIELGTNLKRDGFRLTYTLIIVIVYIRRVLEHWSNIGKKERIGCLLSQTIFDQLMVMVNQNSS